MKQSGIFRKFKLLIKSEKVKKNSMRREELGTEEGVLLNL